MVHFSGLCLLTLVGFSACNKQGCSGDSITESALRDSVKTYFNSFSIGGGWEPVFYTSYKGEVNVGVEIPQAARIMQNPPAAQFAALSVACPGKIESLWKIPGLKDIVIQGLASGEIFITVSCNAWGH